MKTNLNVDISYKSVLPITMVQRSIADLKCHFTIKKIPNTKIIHYIVCLCKMKDVQNSCFQVTKMLQNIM